MYNELFTQTGLTNYRIAKILNVHQKDIPNYKKRKTIDLTQFIRFMELLNISSFKSENEKFSVEVKIK